MPYVVYPVWARRGEQVALIARYTPLLALMAHDLLVDSMPVPALVSAIGLLACLLCIGGAATRRYHFEWIGLSTLATTLLIGVGIMIPRVSGLTVWLAVALALSLGDRWVRLARESWAAREEHRIREEAAGE